MNTVNENPEDILRGRARALARPADKAEVPGAMLELLEFRLAQERYAIENRHVQEVCPLKDLTPLPCTPSFMRGIINVRGRIVPVYDLKKFFDLPDQGITDLHRVVLVKNRELELGLLTDIVVSVKTIPAEALQSSLPTLTGIRSDYLKGVTSDRLIVLNLAHILADPKIVVHEEVAT